MAGAEIVLGLRKQVEAFLVDAPSSSPTRGRLTMHKRARVVGLLVEAERVVGAIVERGGRNESVRAANVVIATGGYAADRSPTSLLAENRPDLLSLPTTNG